MRKRTSSVFVCGYALFIALGISGCGGGTIKEGMPTETAPSPEQLKQDEEVGAKNADALNPAPAKPK
jgi:hypothetical protein